jgi:hypothetical protein
MKKLTQKYFWKQKKLEGSFQCDSSKYSKQIQRKLKFGERNLICNAVVRQKKLCDWARRINVGKFKIVM